MFIHHNGGERADRSDPGGDNGSAPHDAQQKPVQCQAGLLQETTAQLLLVAHQGERYRQQTYSQLQYLYGCDGKENQINWVNQLYKLHMTVTYIVRSCSE